MRNVSSSVALDINGTAVVKDGHYVVSVPSKYVRAFGRFQDVVIKAEDVDHLNKVVKLDARSSGWIRTGWLKPVNLGPVLTLEKEKITQEAVSTVFKSLDSKVLNAVAGARGVERPRRRVLGKLAVAAALLVAGVGSFFGYSMLKSSATVAAAPVVAPAAETELSPVEYLVINSPSLDLTVR